MKKLILLMMLIIPLISYSQTNNLNGFELKKPDLKLEMLRPSGVSSYGYGNSPRLGPLIMLGGATLMTASLLTVPMKQWRGVNQTSPYVRSTPRFMSIMLGGVTLSCGIVISLTGN